MTADLAHVLVVDDDARLRELLRRYLTENGFRVATAANAGEDLIHLTQAEAALLTVFAERPGITLTRDDLTAAGIAAAQARTVDVQVTRLRRKIEPDPKFPRYLQTVRGKGYVLQPD